MPVRETAPRTIAFAGGGSGGHLSPGLAIAEAFESARIPLRAKFLCSQRPIDAEILGAAGVDFAPIPARPGRSLRALWAFPGAVRAGGRLLRECDAAVLVSLGGFISLPVALAARRARIPILLVNLDAVAGRANRFVARVATRVLSAVPTRHLAVADSDIVGMPIRRAARADRPPPDCRARLGLDPQRRTLLVTGASQGSSSLNEAVPSILSRAASRELRRDWQVLHLAGSLNEPRLGELMERYRTAGIPALVVPFLHQMGAAWGAATLAVTRGGASSVAEAAANCVPSIVVPFPHHRDRHQRLNAAPFVSLGAFRLAADPSHETGEDAPLAEVLIAALGDSSFLESAAARLRSTGRTDPGARVVREVESLISRRDGR